MSNKQKRNNLLKKNNTFYNSELVDLKRIISLEYLLNEYGLSEKYSITKDNGFKYNLGVGIDNEAIRYLLTNNMNINHNDKVNDLEFYNGLKDVITLGAANFKYKQDDFLYMLVNYLYLRDFSKLDVNTKDIYRYLSKINKIFNLSYEEFRLLLVYIEDELGLNAYRKYRGYEKQTVVRERIRKRGIVNGK